jgi:hypothetical protein
VASDVEKVLFNFFFLKNAEKGSMSKVVVVSSGLERVVVVKMSYSSFLLKRPILETTQICSYFTIIEAYRFRYL